jgi:hypothetical protein
MPHSACLPKRSNHTAAARLASAFYGYGHMLSVRPAAEQTAKALVQALEHAKLTTTVSGTMSLSPDSELRLAPGQTVKLDEGATVKLDPTSSVRVVGDLKIDMPQPSKQQLQLDATTEGLFATHMIGIDGSPRRPTPLMNLKFNFDGAYANCVWVSGT